MDKTKILCFIIVAGDFLLADLMMKMQKVDIKNSLLFVKERESLTVFLCYIDFILYLMLK